MKILALEFSSPQRSVALVQHGVAPVFQIEHEVVETGPPPNKPFGMIEEVLRQAGLDREQIDGLAIGLGPGSYTGIRGAIALAQGWQLGRGVNLQGVSSAQCVAAQAHADGLTGRIAVVIDAQRGEFYLANYELTSSSWREIAVLRLASHAMVADCEKQGEVLVGPEVGNWFPQGRTIFPRATMLGKLALSSSDAISADKLEPIYLRMTNFVKAPPSRMLPE
jgi:tRNA threonylcarbamoyladenosine biosynthesis protein TsaB